MYDEVMHQGKMLPEWQKELQFQYSLGELYRMVSEECDFNELVSRNDGCITFD